MLDLERPLRDEDHVGAASEPGVQRDPARVPAHHLDDQGPVVALRGGVQPVDRLHRDVDRGVEAEREIGGTKIVIDGLRHPDHLDALLEQLGGDTEGVLAADRDQRVHAEAGHVVGDPLHAGPPVDVGLERIRPRRAQNRAAAGQDPADRLHVEGDGVALERTAPPVAEADEFIAVLLHALADNRTDDGVQPGAVAAAGEHSHSHLDSSRRAGWPETVPRATLVPMNVLAIDAGTTGVTALVVSAEGKIRGRGYAEFRQHYPRARLGRASARGNMAGDAFRGQASARGRRDSAGASASRTNAKRWWCGTAARWPRPAVRSSGRIAERLRFVPACVRRGTSRG